MFDLGHLTPGIRWRRGIAGPPPFVMNWDPANTSSLLNLSNSNLTTTNINVTGQDRQCRATFGRTDTSGKFYFEQHLDDRWTEIGLAVGNAAAPLDSALYGAGSNAVVCLGNGYFGYNGTQISSPVGLATGDYVGMLWDAATDMYTVYKNGSSIAASVSACPLSGAKFPMHTSYGTNDKATVNFGLTPFSFQPSGSTSWDGNRTA